MAYKWLCCKVSGIKKDLKGFYSFKVIIIFQFAFIFIFDCVLKHSVLFPLYSANRFWGEVHKHTVDALYLVGDAVG